MNNLRSWALVVAMLGMAQMAAAQGALGISWKGKQLTDVYYSEGAAVADLNRDGKMDLVYGPYWYEGPDFEKKHEIYAPKPQPMNFYADNFFMWAQDFDHDGWQDLLMVGLPGTPAFVFINPAGKDEHWARHTVFPSVGNESPWFADLLGSGKPVLVCTYKGAFGYVQPNWDKPLEPWTFHTISAKGIKEQTPHGLGVGDVNGDGRLDVVMANGWFEQPAANADSTPWTLHPVAFTNAYGGAEMHVYDVNGDGKNDVITSLAAHDFGLAWYEQTTVRGQVVFREHTIVGKKPEENPYGLVFSELHSVALVDIDGDGLKDIVTGKTYWSHHKASPMWDAGAVVYWFKLQRNAKGVDWIPYRIDGDAGIGRQIRTEDVNGDKRPDILVGGMKGGHMFVQEGTGQAAEAPKRVNLDHPLLVRGPDSAIDPKTGTAEGVIEAESLKVVGTPPGQVSVQGMEGFKPDQWSGGKQLYWTGGKVGDRLELEMNVEKAGEYELRAALTMARDYAVVQPLLDGQPLGGELDLYNSPNVLTTGVLTLGRRELAAGKHQFGLEIKGANPSATPSYMVGIDFIQLAAPGKGLCIVAPEKFHEALNDYVQFKQALIPTELVSLEKVLASTPGADDPERLKHYLYSAWRERNVGYVLLVGDVDAMPVRYMVLDRVTPAAFDYAFYPSDLYYADLARADGSFEDWNGHKEDFHAGYYGEVRGEKNKADPINFDGVDYRPEVAVGRWPVSTAAQVGVVAGKSINYERSVRSHLHPGAGKAAIFHPNGWVDARFQLNRIGQELNGSWRPSLYLFGSQASQPNEANLVAAMDAGAGLVLHAGHGSERTWEQCFTMKGLKKLHNQDRLPIMMSAGCSTAYFAPLAPYDGYVDVAGKEHRGTYAKEVFTAPPPPPAPYQHGKYNPSGLGEALLRDGADGAVVYIGCCTGSQPCGLTLLEGFARAAGSPGYEHVGDCWTSAVSYYYDKEHLATLKPNDDWYPPSIFFQGMKFMFFGDPTLPLAAER